MYRAREKFNAVEVCTGDETMKRTLPFLLEQLELCQKSLSGYVISKHNLIIYRCKQILPNPFGNVLNKTC